MKIDTLKEMLSISETSKHATIWTISLTSNPANNDDKYIAIQTAVMYGK